MMTKELFWQIIEQAGISNGNSVDEGIRVVQDALSAYSPEDMVMFQIFFDAYKDVADSDLVMGLAGLLMGCADYDECADVFDYFLDMLVFYGKERYLKTLKDPDSFVEILKEEQEEYDVEALNCISYAPFVDKTPDGDYKACYEKLMFGDAEKYDLMIGIVFSPYVDEEYDEFEELEDVLPGVFRLIRGEE